MKTTNKPHVYVVVRQGRRIEPTNYTDINSARKRRSKLIKTLEDNNDPFAHKVWVKKTTKPWTIR